jgi:hypothetical protein
VTDEPKFNFKRFLVESFGSPQGLLSFLRAYDVDLPGASAVEKWFYRESVPSGWFAVLAAYLQLERGVPPLASYLGE